MFTLFDEKEGISAIGIFVAEEHVELGIEEQLENATPCTAWKYPIPDFTEVDVLMCLNSSELWFLEDGLSRQSQLWIDIDMH